MASRSSGLRAISWLRPCSPSSAVLPPRPAEIAAASAGRKVASTMRRAGSGRRATCASQSSVEASLQWISSSVSTRVRPPRWSRPPKSVRAASARGSRSRAPPARVVRSRPQRGHLGEPAWRMGRENGPDTGAFGRGAEAGQGFDQGQIGLADAMMSQALPVGDFHGTAIEPVGEGVDERSCRCRARPSRTRSGAGPTAPGRSAFRGPPFRPAAPPASTARMDVRAALRQAWRRRSPASPAPSGDSRGGAASRCSEGGARRRRALAAAPGCRR